ncbi:threonine/serine exporter family protein [Fonticella tunisiensis]|uniref:Uncharacterized membrane protein YjjB (DUF3815 family) n=1 Tax=Fonticella tunisiensis TaxID=1096341 RepID=A0A4R7KU52_9CLOT|nr:threonine/serine exporter family protein [Fonticella tunisiensis]TDT63678.1 uncharacterized membrane protein YjjB (DUF3815 family) [Fonticella tunisiensis]
MKELILAFLGSFFPAVLFNIERKNLIWAGLSGAIGWGIYVLLYKITGGVVMAIFVGAVCVGIYGEAMARILKTPASVFTVPGIFPLVPGITAYNTVLAIVEDRIRDAYDKGIETIASAGAIAFGIILSTAVFKFFKQGKMAKTMDGEE